MRQKKELPINGVVNALSTPIDNIEPGMHFFFDGRTLSILPDEPLDDAQLMELMFQDLGTTPLHVDAIIEGSLRPSGEYIAFHVSCYPGMKNRGVRLGVVAYWIIDDDSKLEDIDRLRFSGLCIDSFCPMTHIATAHEENRRSITAVTCSEDAIDLGIAQIRGDELKLSANAFWTYEFARRIEFESRLLCDVASPDYMLMRDIYTSVAAALRFCLGRGNVDFDIELCKSDPAGWDTIGEFTALHGKMYVPDEYDELHCKFLRAENVGEHFGQIVSAFAQGLFYGKALSHTREDVNVITYSKIIELTSSFEREFRGLFPDGVEHSVETKRASNLAKEAVCKAAEQLTGKSKKIVTRLGKRISEDNLETRIRDACKRLPEDISILVFQNTGANQKYTLLGRKITEIRNDIAHGNALRHELNSIRNEYKLLLNLVFAMQLMRLGLSNDDVAQLLKYVV